MAPSFWNGRVAAGVIAVEVRVDQILDRQRRDRFDGGLDLVVQRRELAVHHDDAVGADRDRDVAALAFEHIGVVAEIGGLDLDLGEIARWRCRGRSLLRTGVSCEQGRPRPQAPTG